MKSEPLIVQIELDEWGQKSRILLGGLDISPYVKSIEVEGDYHFATKVSLELIWVKVQGLPREGDGHG